MSGSSNPDIRELNKNCVEKDNCVSRSIPFLVTMKCPDRHMSATCFKIEMFRDWRLSTKDRLSRDVTAKLGVPYSVTHASESNFGGEFHGEMRLKRVLLPFPST